MLDFQSRSVEEKIEQKYNRKIPNGGVVAPVYSIPGMAT